MSRSTFAQLVARRRNQTLKACDTSVLLNLLTSLHQRCRTDSALKEIQVRSTGIVTRFDQPASQNARNHEDTAMEDTAMEGTLAPTLFSRKRTFGGQESR